MKQRKRTDLMYGTAKQITGTNKYRNGHLLTEPEEIRVRWKEYLDTRYDEGKKPQW